MPDARRCGAEGGETCLKSAPVVLRQAAGVGQGARRKTPDDAARERAGFPKSAPVDLRLAPGAGKTRATWHAVCYKDVADGSAVV